MEILILAFLIGCVCGLRSFTAPAVVAWAAHLHWLDLHGSPVGFMASQWTVGIFTVLALGELVADKLPKMPSRTEPPGVIARMLFGGLTGACLALAGGSSLAIGACLGVVGGLTGMFAGSQWRSKVEKAFGAPDIVMALLEDAVAVGGGFLIVSRFNIH